MSKREAQLMRELEERKIKCCCGAVEYPPNWMRKTQEKLKKAGVIKVCADCTTETQQLLVIASRGGE